MKKKLKKKEGAMIESQSFFNHFELSPYAVAGLIAVTGIIILFYMLASPRPYDDDNIGRYFMAQAALSKPEYVINMWGRPLAIIFFLVPAQFGYWYCASATALLTLAGLYLIYRAARAAEMSNAWLAVVFFIFQPLALMTSFSLCTEPLAAFFLTLGLFFYYRQLWIPASLSLSLMPLARTELTLLLPILAIALIRKKQWLSVLLLGTGLILFQITGMMMTGDYLFLLTAAKSAGHGLYANGPFEHYFERFIFIVGPVVFIFMLIQIVFDIREKRLTVLNTSFLLMFAVHVYFYWKGNVASIGFLRHFVAISPIMALLALEGFNRWFYDQPENERERIHRMVLSAVLIAGMLITLFFYSVELQGHYFLTDKKEYLKLGIILAIGIFFMMNKYLNMTGQFWKSLMIAGVVLMTAGYSLIKEKPLKLAPEHQTVKNFQVYYANKLKNQIPSLMIVHPWFFFFDDFNYYRDSLATRNYLDMRLENLPQLPVGGYIAWDSHYSWRLSSNVALDSLKNNPQYRFVQPFISSDQKFAIYLFRKESR